MQKEQRIQTICLLILCAVALTASLKWLQPVMVPFVLALFITIGLTPILNWQTRHLKLPRLLALGLTLLTGLLLVLVFSWLTSLSINQMVTNADSYQANIKKLVGKANALMQLGQPQGAKGQATSSLQMPMKFASSLLITLSSALLELFSRGVLVLVFSGFLLIGGSGATRNPNGFLGDVEAKIRSYLLNKVFFSGITGVAVFLVLHLLGVKLAMVFGFLAFVLNFIPSIGSIVATLLPLPVVLLSSELSVAAMVFAIVLPGMVQFFVGNLIEPKVMGDSFDLHPVVVLMALIFWGMLWGIPGMLLATPITAILKIILERYEITAPIAEVMAGRLEQVDRQNDAPKKRAVEESEHATGASESSEKAEASEVKEVSEKAEDVEGAAEVSKKTEVPEKDEEAEDASEDSESAADDEVKDAQELQKEEATDTSQEK